MAKSVFQNFDPLGVKMGVKGSKMTLFRVKITQKIRFSDFHEIWHRKAFEGEKNDGENHFSKL